MAGIYIHIPFCRRVCAYCDFYKSVRTERLAPVLEAMHRELDERRNYLNGQPVETLYVGGGTPSVCTPGELGSLVARVRKLFGGPAPAETTVEVNPDDLTPACAAGLRAAGFDRLSMGIQSLDDGALRLMNRRHDAATALRAFEAARAAGFGNLSVDLIYGVPGFGGPALQRTLEGLLALRPEHISAYHLTVEPDTAFGRRQARGLFRPVEESVSEAEFARVHRMLTEAGYEHYEVSNFALPGFRARHNAAYWHGVPYLGIGPGAHSYDGRSRRWSTDTAESYGEGPFRFEEERLTDRDLRNEYLMTRLRCAEGISLADFADRFGREAAEKLRRAAAPLLRSGGLTGDGARMAIPAERFLTSDWVIGTLFEPEEAESSEP